MRKIIEFGQDQAEALEGYADELDETQTGILRTGFRLFREAVVASRAGGRIAIVGSDGSVSPLIGPWDDLRPRTPAA